MSMALTFEINSTVNIVWNTRETGDMYLGRYGNSSGSGREGCFLVWYFNSWNVENCQKDKQVTPCTPFMLWQKLCALPKIAKSENKFNENLVRHRGQLFFKSFQPVCDWDTKFTLIHYVCQLHKCWVCEA